MFVFRRYLRLNAIPKQPLIWRLIGGHGILFVQKQLFNETLIFDSTTIVFKQHVQFPWAQGRIAKPLQGASKFNLAYVSVAVQIVLFERPHYLLGRYVGAEMFADFAQDQCLAEKTNHSFRWPDCWLSSERNVPSKNAFPGSALARL